MAEALEELPLFLLETVLFPYASIQLHVFEERYRQMVQDCLDLDRPFGIVLIREGQEVGDPTADPYLVGTAVRIEKVQRHDDGTLDLHVQGERRFRIRRFDKSRPYLVGHVEPVLEHENEDSPRAHALATRVREDFQMLVEGLLSRPSFNVQVIFPSDPMALSFTVANFLQMENREKQRLLETTDTLERLQELIPTLAQHLSDLEALRRQLHGETENRRRLQPEDFEDWVQPN